MSARKALPALSGTAKSIAKICNFVKSSDVCLATQRAAAIQCKERLKGLPAHSPEVTQSAVELLQGIWIPPLLNVLPIVGASLPKQSLDDLCQLAQTTDRWGLGMAGSPRTQGKSRRELNKFRQAILLQIKRGLAVGKDSCQPTQLLIALRAGRAKPELILNIIKLCLERDIKLAAALQSLDVSTASVNDLIVWMDVACLILRALAPIVLSGPTKSQAYGHRQALRQDARTYLWLRTSGLGAVEKEAGHVDSKEHELLLLTRDLCLNIDRQMKKFSKDGADSGAGADDLQYWLQGQRMGEVALACSYIGLQAPGTLQVLTHSMLASGWLSHTPSQPQNSDVTMILQALVNVGQACPQLTFSIVQRLCTDGVTDLIDRPSESDGGNSSKQFRGAGSKGKGAVRHGVRRQPVRDAEASEAEFVWHSEGLESESNMAAWPKDPAKWPLSAGNPVDEMWQPITTTTTTNTSSTAAPVHSASRKPTSPIILRAAHHAVGLGRALATEQCLQAYTAGSSSIFQASGDHWSASWGGRQLFEGKGPWRPASVIPAEDLRAAMHLLVATALLNSHVCVPEPVEGDAATSSPEPCIVHQFGDRLAVPPPAGMSSDGSPPSNPAAHTLWNTSTIHMTQGVVQFCRHVLAFDPLPGALRANHVLRYLKYHMHMSDAAVQDALPLVLMSKIALPVGGAMTQSEWDEIYTAALEQAVMGGMDGSMDPSREGGSDAVSWESLMQLQRREELLYNRVLSRAFPSQVSQLQAFCVERLRAACADVPGLTVLEEARCPNVPHLTDALLCRTEDVITTADGHKSIRGGSGSHLVDYANATDEQALYSGSASASDDTASVSERIATWCPADDVASGHHRAGYKGTSRTTLPKQSVSTLAPAPAAATQSASTTRSDHAPSHSPLPTAMPWPPAQIVSTPHVVFEVDGPTHYGRYKMLNGSTLLSDAILRHSGHCVERIPFFHCYYSAQPAEAHVLRKRLEERYPELFE